MAHSESAQCPQCGSIARDRFLFWCFRKRSPESLGARVLETSPRLGQEYRDAMGAWFSYTCSDYDLSAHKGVVQLVTGFRTDRITYGPDGATLVAVDGRPAGIVTVADPIKETTHEALRALHSEGIRIVMLTGDNRTTAEAVAKHLDRPMSALGIVFLAIQAYEYSLLAHEGQAPADFIAAADHLVAATGQRARSEDEESASFFHAPGHLLRGCARCFDIARPRRHTGIQHGITFGIEDRQCR